MARYRGHRVPSLGELVPRPILENIYTAYTHASNVALAIFWPDGAPCERASWEPLNGLDYANFHGGVCQACGASKPPGGAHLPRELCREDNIVQVWETARLGQETTFVCRNAGFIHLGLPLVFEGAVIGVVIAGQLRPQAGALWDTTGFGGLDERGPNVNLAEVSLRRLQATQKNIGEDQELLKLASEHRPVGPDELREFREGLRALAAVLLELAQTQAHLDRHRLFDHIRVPWTKEWFERSQFWARLSRWIEGGIPEDSFVLVVLFRPDSDHATVALSSRLPQIPPGTYRPGDHALWKRLVTLQLGGQSRRRDRVTNLLDGQRLPPCRSLVSKVGQHGFLIYGVPDLSEGPQLWPEEERALCRLGEEIGLLLDLIEKAKAKEEFLISFSHELRSPIHNSYFTIDRIRCGRFQESGGLNEACRLLKAQLDRLLKLVENVWQLQRILAGQAKYVTTRTNLYDLLAHCSAQVRDTSDRDDIKIILDRTQIASLPAIEFDRQALELVIYNLLDNAAKYSSAGTEIRVYGCRHGGHVQLTFTNLGIRMPDPAELDVFQRFTRTDEARCLAPSSSGIGLFLVKNIVEAHDGTVTTESRIHSSRDHLVNLSIRVPIKP
ncbi:MAG: ATP-binding protein [Phycisphaerae bacterium]